MENQGNSEQEATQVDFESINSQCIPGITKLESDQNNFEPESEIIHEQGSF